MPIMKNRADWLLQIVNAALEAGKEILHVYSSSFSVESKKDKSPLTEADKRAHAVITKALEGTKIPILSEEGLLPEFEKRKNWKQFWMVDPLDGTKEFVNRNGEFTVNIALIENGKPTMGVIYIPITKEIYFADDLAYKIDTFSEPVTSLTQLLKKAIQLPIKQCRKDYVILGSRSHMNQETKEFIQNLNENEQNIDIVSKGSSLKFCMIAEGSADIYPRFAPTMEWDTAAGQAIANAAGVHVINWETKKPMTYNKENLLNSWFVVKR
jgi:3'(2'), 5'-bisphosphate nucleotidase